MKIDIYTLLGMIKDGKAPKKILYKKIIGRVGSEEEIYIYNKKDKMYYRENKEKHEYWTDAFMIIPSLDDEVEILETTLNTKDMNITSKKIEKLEDGYLFKIEDKQKISRNFTLSESVLKDKINEIIEVINGRTG